MISAALDRRLPRTLASRCWKLKYIYFLKNTSYTGLLFVGGHGFVQIIAVFFKLKKNFA